MTLKHLDTILQISYPGLTFLVLSKGDHEFLQVACMDGTNTQTGEPLAWKGRKWYLSPHMTASEVVQTAFLAVMTALEHEARETFKFQGAPVMDPHKNLSVVAQEIRE